jgi:DNA-binding NarL/FixJ family response regulator
MARNSNDRWTDEEDKRLLALRAARKSSVVIAAALRRSEASVVGRIYVLKKRAAAGSDVAGPPSINKGSEWSPADEQRLTEMTATGKSLSEIAAALGRTEAAVENRIHVLKHRISAI